MTEDMLFYSVYKLTSKHLSSSASGELFRTVSNIVTKDRRVVTSRTLVFLFYINSHHVISYLDARM